MTPTASDTAPHPPRPRLALTLAATGHRASRIEDMVALAARVDDAVSMLAEALARLDRAPWFTPDPPDLRVLSALAEGADRIIAHTAMAAGFRLDAVLPFTPDDYATDFATAASRTAFTDLLAQADRQLVLPGRRDTETHAYALVGEALVAQGTLLLAVWDGAPALGQGGTADVVAHAIENGVPVIQIPLDAAPLRMIWSGFAPFATRTRDAMEAAARPVTPDSMADLLQQLLLPPAEPIERADLAAYFNEQQRLRQWRLEYPLLLALSGVQALSRRSWRRDPYTAATAADWADYRRAGGVSTAANAEALDQLQAAYSWADNLATHFAQALRSGHVVNFVVAALAVLVALSGLLLPGIKLYLVLFELLLIVLMIWNTRAGIAGEWQRRWLDYRNLAERLRPIRSLKLLGVTSPPRPPARKRSSSRRWQDWVVTAHWRAMGMPDGVIDAERLMALPRLVAEHELAGEIAYHRRNAHRMRHLEHQLHRLGSLAFAGTILLCLLFPILYLGLGGMSHEVSLMFVMASAGLPSIGGATYALRTHGDYAGNAGRSAETADELDAIRAALMEGHVSLLRSGALTAAAARVMLVDLAEWRLTYEQRSLAIPG